MKFDLLVRLQFMHVKERSQKQLLTNVGAEERIPTQRPMTVNDKI